jgi:hypothetical protein
VKVSPDAGLTADNASHIRSVEEVDHAEETCVHVCAREAQRRWNGAGDLPPLEVESWDATTKALFPEQLKYPLGYWRIP